MTYFPDLSPYEYGDHNEPMLNVGWLDSQHSFEKGLVSPSAVERLLLLAGNPHNVMRGLHYCEFCDEESPVRLAAPVAKGFVSLGTGEIRVRNEALLYCAPTLVLHYILNHGYKPPAEFLRGLEGATT